MSNRDNSTCTAYPRLFEKCYWGQHPLKPPYPVNPLEQVEKLPESTIVHARNKFIEDHHIVRHYKNNYSCMRIHGLDHQEFWVDREGRVVHIYSECKYRGVYPGFKQIRPMYDLGQITCLRKIETTASKKKLMKTLFSKMPDFAALLIQEYLVVPKKARVKRARLF